MDGVWRGKPGGARVLLGAERPVEGLGDGAQVKGTHCRCRNTVALWTDGQRNESKRKIAENIKGVKRQERAESDEGTKK